MPRIYISTVNTSGPPPRARALRLLHKSRRAFARGREDTPRATVTLRCETVTMMMRAGGVDGEKGLSVRLKFVV